MDFVYLLDSASLDEVEGSLVHSIMNEHYHKARTLQRALTLIDDKDKKNITECDCFINEEDLLVLTATLKGNNGDNVVDTINGYSCDEFTVEASITKKELKIIVSQNFEGREDDILYGD